MKVNERAYILETGEEVVIREATTKDATSLQRTIDTYTALSEYLLNTSKLTNEEGLQWVKDISSNSDSLLLIAICDDKIIGNVDITGTTEGESDKAGLLGMGILSAYQSKGLGRLLLNASIDWAKHNSDLDSLVLQVFGNNRTAVKLYKSAGFIEEVRQEGSSKDSHGNYFDSVIMSLKL